MGATGGGVFGASATPMSSMSGGPPPLSAGAPMMFGTDGRFGGGADVSPQFSTADSSSLSIKYFLQWIFVCYIFVNEAKHTSFAIYHFVSCDCS